MLPLEKYSWQWFEVVKVRFGQVLSTSSPFSLKKNRSVFSCRQQRAALSALTL